MSRGFISRGFISRRFISRGFILDALMVLMLYIYRGLDHFDAVPQGPFELWMVLVVVPRLLAGLTMMPFSALEEAIRQRRLRPLALWLLAALAVTFKRRWAEPYLLQLGMTPLRPFGVCQELPALAPQCYKGVPSGHAMYMVFWLLRSSAPWRVKLPFIIAVSWATLYGEYHTPGQYLAGGVLAFGLHHSVVWLL